HLRGERAIVSCPAHVALYALSEGFLRDADLQGPETGIAADLRGDRLIDGRSAGAAPGKRLSRHQGAHGAVMPVSGSRNLSGGIIQPGDDMDVVPEWRQRRKAGRQRKPRAGLGGNPVHFITDIMSSLK